MVSFVRRSSQASEFSHVGVTHLWQDGTIGVFESVQARDPLPDALSGRTNKSSARLVQLRDKLTYYASQGECKWENPTTGERVVKVGLLRFMLIRVNETDDMEAVRSLLYERFCAFQRMECEKDFTQSKLQMARAGARIVWCQLY